MANIFNSDSFETWLGDQSAATCAALATRATLRTLPLNQILLSEYPNNNEVSIFILSHLSALAALWFSSTSPLKGSDVRSAARAAVNSSSALATRTQIANLASTAAHYASIACDSSHSSLIAGRMSAISAATSATQAAVGAVMLEIDADGAEQIYDSFWTAVSNDAQRIAVGNTPDMLMRQPLWYDAMPLAIQSRWEVMKRELLARQQNWHVWTNWYDDRLLGEENSNSRQIIPELERDRILMPSEEDWNKGAFHINTLLQELETNYRAPDQLPRESDHPAKDVPPYVFVSYKREDETFARSIIDALAIEGIDTWWDQKIPADTNFRSHIAEMLEKAGCILTIWSKDALHSDWLHDEAERGRQRGRLVQVTMDSTLPLPPFSARQVTNLSRWNGDPKAPDFSRIIAGIRSCFSKVDTPDEKNQALLDGVHLKSRTAVTIKNDKLHLTETPPDGEKPIDRSHHAQRAVQEQAERVKGAIGEVERSQRNFNKNELLPRLERYYGALVSESPDYIVVQPAWEPLGASLLDEFLLDAVDPGLKAVFNALLTNHKGVQAAIHKARGDGTEERIDVYNSVGPQIDENKLDAPEIVQALHDTSEIVSSPEASAILDETASTVVKANIDQYEAGRANQEKYDLEAKERGKKWMGSAVVRVAGAAIGIVASLTNIAEFVGIPSASALLAKLKDVLAILLRVFSD